MSQRIDQQPAYLLHSRAFRDSSQILDILSLDHGKLSVVARGIRSPKSRLAGVLRPFQPLRMSWTIRTELGTLTGAEMNGGPRSLSGDALLAGYYVNELIMHFLHRHDPQPEVFDTYEQTLVALAEGHSVPGSLRQFEMELLRLVGYAVNLATEAGSDQSIAAQQSYEFRPGQGPVPVSRTEGPAVFTGEVLLAIGDCQFDEPDVLRQANRLMRLVVDHHLDGRELKTRKVLMELHRGRLAAPEKA